MYNKIVEYYCDLCDKAIKIEYKTKHLQSLTHNDREKCIQKTHYPKS